MKSYLSPCHGKHVDVGCEQNRGRYVLQAAPGRFVTAKQVGSTSAEHAGSTSGSTGARGTRDGTW